MSKYIDRGIIKWSPFDSLAGFVDVMEELKYQLGQKPRPILLDDKRSDMDYVLQEALEYKKDISISYYYDGYTKIDFGMITKVDTINRTIRLNQTTYSIDDIVNLTLKE